MMQIIRRYLCQNTSQRDSVAKAAAAFHESHRDPGAHLFSTSWRESKCRWCGRSRDEVRYDDLPAQCGLRPSWADESIESVVRREETLFENVFERAKKLSTELQIESLTGADLARLHHTHGIDPSMLEIALMDAGRRSLPQKLHDEYQVVYKTHRETGRRGLAREVIVAKTAP